MQAGDLNQRVTLQQQTTTQDAVGQPVLSWADLATLWANIRPQTGAESMRSNADISVVQASVRIRYFTPCNAGMRLLWGSAYYNIKAVLIDPRKRYIDLVCEVINART